MRRSRALPGGTRSAASCSARVGQCTGFRAAAGTATPRLQAMRATVARHANEGTIRKPCRGAAAALHRARSATGSPPGGREGSSSCRLAEILDLLFEALAMPVLGIQLEQDPERQLGLPEIALAQEGIDLHHRLLHRLLLLVNHLQTLDLA